MSHRAADAITKLYAALREDPNNAALHNNLGCIYYRQGQIQDAILIFEKTIRISPDNWEAHYNLGNCYVKLDMLSQAIEHYQSVLSLKPDHESAQINLAMVFVSQKRYADALPYLKMAAIREPEFAELQGHLAEAFLDLGETASATEQFEKATSLEPTRADWQHNLAVLYLRSHQHDLAKKRFEITLELDPNNHTALHMLRALSQEYVDHAPTEYVKDLFDQYAAYYNKHVAETLEYKVPVLIRQALGQFINEHSSLQKILDIGCGTGLCAIYFRDMASELIGVDLSFEMLRHAQSLQAYDGLACCDIRKTIPGIGTKNFDLIIAADVLGYLGDLSELFAHVRSAIKDGGMFAFSVEHSEREEGFTLRSTGRFAHTSHYLQQLAAEFSFSIIHSQLVIIRKQLDEEIEGEIFVLKAMLVI